jgi:hypothetical protein
MGTLRIFPSGKPAKPFMAVAGPRAAL